MKFLTAFIIVFFSLPAVAQLTTSANTASSLVQNVLIGSGVSVSNINFTGSSSAIGQFDGSNCNVGLASGIVMTTGTIYNNGAGPQGPNNQHNSGIDNGTPGYPLLSNQIGGVNTYNASVLEFDFIPLSDTVKFRYVFGSEEYPEYVNAGYNDVFGFFISGPGISGIQNIAKVPGTGSLVSIDNVNAGSNASYFVNNGTGQNSSATSYTDPHYIQYDGFTVPMTAIAKVECGQTYHIIMAIADAGDGIYDSGIFLEANSFTSPTLVDVKYQLSNLSFGANNIMAEGCTDATVTVTRHASDISQPLTITLNATGTATEGVDYSNLPTSVTIPANQTQVSFTLSAFSDALVEGQESIDINFDIPDPCGNSNQTTIHLFIQDIEDLAVTMADAEVLCQGDDATLTPVVTGGGSGYNYLWSDGSTGATLTDNPAVTTNYSVTVSDNCLNQSVTVNANINVPVFGPIILNTSPDTANPCPYEPYDFFVEANGGAGNYTYNWYDNKGVNYGTVATQHVVPSETTTYYIVVTDRCGTSSIDSVTVTITSPPLVVNIFGDTTICSGDSALFSATATGGYGNYHFYWPYNGDTTSQTWIVPRHTETITVEVQDDCHTFTVSASGQLNVVRPIANFIPSSTTLYEGLPITFHNTTYGGNSYYWTFGDGQNSTQINPNNTYDTAGVYYITLYATNELGCRDSIIKPITIIPEFYIYVPNAITPNGDGINDFFYASTINVVDFDILIFDRWGEQLFHSDDKRFNWDATYQGKLVQDGVYVYKLHYTSINGDDKTMYGHVVVLK